MMQLVVPATLVMAAGVFVAFAALVWAFVTSDFSVALVTGHSHWREADDLQNFRHLGQS